MERGVGGDEMEGALAAYLLRDGLSLRELVGARNSIARRHSTDIGHECTFAALALPGRHTRGGDGALVSVRPGAQPTN